MTDYDIDGWHRLGAVVRDGRHARGLTQVDMAARAGVSRAWLAKLEAGHRHAEVEQLFRVLAALDLTLTIRPLRRSAGEAAALAALTSLESLT